MKVFSGSWSKFCFSFGLKIFLKLSKLAEIATCGCKLGLMGSRWLTGMKLFFDGEISSRFWG